MVVEVSFEKLNDILDFAWNIYCQKNISSYRRFENKKEMEESFIKTMNHQSDKLLAVYQNDLLTGVLSLMVIKEDCYLQSRGVYFKADAFEDFSEMIKYIKERYLGFEMLLGYPKDAENAIAFIEKFHAECIESNLTMTLNKKDFILTPCDIEVTTITEDLFEKYAKYHDAHYLNVYWTSSKIKENFGHWKIYAVIISDIIVAAVHIDIRNKFQAEIFGLSVDKNSIGMNYESALLSKSISDIFAGESASIFYMIDDNSLTELKVAEQIGFKLIEKYVCYKLVF